MTIHIQVSHIDIVITAEHLQNFTARAYARTSAAAIKVSKYHTFMGVDKDTTLEVCMETIRTGSMDGQH